MEAKENLQNDDKEHHSREDDVRRLRIFEKKTFEKRPAHPQLRREAHSEWWTYIHL